MDKLDAKTLLTLISLIANFAGIIGTWAVMQYRMEAIEAKLILLEQRVAATESANIEQIAQVKCLICEAHGIPCPGC